MKPRRFPITLRDRFGMPARFNLTVWADSGVSAFRLFHSQSTALGRRLAKSTPVHYTKKEDAYALAR
jgi:hypothetical protein